MRKFFVTGLLFLCSFIPKNNPGCNETKLYQIAKFPIGVALDPEKLMKDENYWKIAVNQFNSFTPEILLKPKFLQPSRAQFEFSEMDQLLTYCEKYNIRVHGHTLIWHKGLPAWMEKFKGSRQDWEQLMKDHIQSVIKHFKGRIKSWDVVNEAFNDDGTLRKNIWLKNIGEDYIEKAFTYATEMDKDAKLFYNDYSLEVNGPKQKAVLKYLQDLRSKGVKIDGIGMQMHVRLDYPDITEINKSARKIHEAGFLVHYSELDVSLIQKGIFTSGARALERQKERMKDIVKGYMELSEVSRFGITLWGVSDNDSWLSEQNGRARPVLFDSRYRTKPAYCGFLEGLENKPK